MTMPNENISENLAFVEKVHSPFLSQWILFDSSVQQGQIVVMAIT